MIALTTSTDIPRLAVEPTIAWVKGKGKADGSSENPPMADQTSLPLGRITKSVVADNARSQARRGESGGAGRPPWAAAAKRDVCDVARSARRVMRTRFILALANMTDPPNLTSPIKPVENT